MLIDSTLVLHEPPRKLILRKIRKSNKSKSYSLDFVCDASKVSVIKFILFLIEKKTDIAFIVWSNKKYEQRCLWAVGFFYLPYFLE